MPSGSVSVSWIVSVRPSSDHRKSQFSDSGLPSASKKLASGQLGFIASSKVKAMVWSVGISTALLGVGDTSCGRWASTVKPTSKRSVPWPVRSTKAPASATSV